MGRSPSQRQGHWAEQRALRLLQAAGWRLLEQRWCCRWGELAKPYPRSQPLA